jgi:hypothetical protein
VARERINEVDFRVPAHEPHLSLWLLSLLDIACLPRELSAMRAVREVAGVLWMSGQAHGAPRVAVDQARVDRHLEAIADWRVDRPERSP